MALGFLHGIGQKWCRAIGVLFRLFGAPIKAFIEKYLGMVTTAFVALVIGGPDGLDPAFRQGAHERIRLSDLTLPHAMVRVLLIEQLYRAWSVNAGHPYHRE